MKILFLILRVLWFPIGLFAVTIFLFKEAVISRKYRASSTGIIIISGRYIMTLFDLYEDQMLIKLMHALPNAAPFALKLLFFPSILQYKVTKMKKGFPFMERLGYEGRKDFITFRTLHIDNMINRHIDSIKQIVFLGAGYDTRSYEKFHSKNINLYELDLEHTQSLKLAALKKANIEYSHVNFLSIDFEKENWFEKLCLSDFDPKLESIFIFEGVSLYLPEEVVEFTFNTVFNNCEHAILLADIYSKKSVDSKVARIIEKTGEKIQFGIDFSKNPKKNIKDFSEAHGARLVNVEFLGANLTEPSMAVAEFENLDEIIVKP